jgi:hypothetical protein
MATDPIVQILIEAAARGRELRAIRERAGVLAVEDQTDQESEFAGAMREATRGDDDNTQ